MRAKSFEEKVDQGEGEKCLTTSLLLCRGDHKSKGYFFETEEMLGRDLP